MHLPYKRLKQKLKKEMILILMFMDELKDEIDEVSDIPKDLKF